MARNAVDIKINLDTTEFEKDIKRVKSMLEKTCEYCNVGQKLYLNSCSNCGAPLPNRNDAYLAKKIQYMTCT